MASCHTCSKKKAECDNLRPRCSACRRAHSKCVYDVSSQPVLRFLDETEQVKSGKKRKFGLEPNGICRLRDIQGQSHDGMEASTGGTTTFPSSSDSFDITPNSWMNGVFDSAQDLAWDFDLSSNNFWNEALFPSLAEDIPEQDRTIRGSPSWTDSNASESLHIEQRQSAIPPISTITDRVLAQHYTESLTSKYSSKKQSWNNHTYFFNRFNRTHSFVVSALYAWTAAHLFCSGKIDSENIAIEHYRRSLESLQSQIGADLLGVLDGATMDGVWSGLLFHEDDLDAISVALYFLAWTDLLLSKATQLISMLKLEADLLQLWNYKSSSALYVRMAVWFCFLEARTTLFCQRNDRIIRLLGDDSGLVHVVERTHGSLQQEYSLLYPEEETAWDQAHKPLYVATCRLVGLIGKISRYQNDEDGMHSEHGVQDLLQDIGKDLNNISEKRAAADKMLSIYFTTNALRHAVEIYASRVYHPDDTLYSMSAHAENIISITRRYYSKVNRPRTEAPSTKIWPIPLVLAGIEARDEIYRDWVLQRMHEYRGLGKHYANAHTFLEKVQATEETGGRRCDLRSASAEMGLDFVI